MDEVGMSGLVDTLQVTANNSNVWTRAQDFLFFVLKRVKFAATTIN